MREVGLRLKQALLLMRVHGPAVFFKKVVIRGPQILSDMLFRQARADRQYEHWIRKNEPSGDDSSRQMGHRFESGPCISIVVPVFNTPIPFLRDMIDSVLNQTYQRWQLCITDGGSNDGQVGATLHSYVEKDERICVRILGENLGIAGNSNAALSLATGEFVCFLDHDDLLSSNALYEAVRAIHENPDADLLYSDEDKITHDGKKRYDPHFKPDWSPDTFCSYNYLCHLTVCRRELITRIGGFREGFDGAQDYDLFLRAAKQARLIVHIPKILYHWRSHESSTAFASQAKQYAFDAGKRALEDALSGERFSAVVSPGLSMGAYRVSYVVLDQPTVALIIPTKDKADVLQRCIESVFRKTEYPHYHVVIVDNGSVDRETFAYYQTLSDKKNIALLSYDKPFNFSSINNYAVRHISDEYRYLLFLNNDMEVISPDWLGEMLGHAQRPEIGAVGAKLYYPNNTIQHAGVIVGIGGAAGHAHKYAPRDTNGYFSRARITQNVSAVTAACLLMRRDVFDAIGGYDEQFSHAFNDVDLCLRIREKGFRIVFTPYAELYHYESISRGYEDTPDKYVRFQKEIGLFQERWNDFLAKGDPCYNPNLTLRSEDFSLNV